MSKRFATPPNPAAQAASVLKAWVYCDEAAFRREINKTVALCSEDGLLEDEHVELLRAIAESLRHKPLDARSEPMVHLCIELLIHLAGPLWPLPSAADGTMPVQD